MNSLQIGMVGLGRMGANMARRLKDLNHPVTAVYDVYPAAAEPLARDLGAKFCDRLADVTAHADVIVTVVTDDAAQRKIFTDTPGTDSLLTGAAGRLFINCATISPAVHVEVERAAEASGAQTLEACMASSIPQARDGTLYLMCGGREEAFRRAEPILRDLGKTVRYVGGAGRAAQVKALVNMVMNINTAGLAEGLGLASALGLDLTMLREVFAETGAASRVLVTDGEDMQNRAHECYFSGAHAAKDSGIALRLAEEHGLNLPLAAATTAQFERMVAEGFGDLDKSGVAELTFPGRGKSI